MSKSELNEVVGGASWGIWVIAGGLVSFLLGLYEGTVNPVRCGR